MAADKKNIVLELNVQIVEIFVIPLLMMASAAIWIEVVGDRMPFNFSSAVIFYHMFFGSLCVVMALIASVSVIKVFLTVNFSFIHTLDQSMLSKLILRSVLAMTCLIYSSLAGYYLITGIVAQKALSLLTKQELVVEGINISGWVNIGLFVLFGLTTIFCKVYLKWFAKKKPTNPSIVVGERKIKTKKEGQSYGVSLNRMIVGVVLISAIFFFIRIEMTMMVGLAYKNITLASTVTSYVILPFILNLIVVLFIYDDKFKDFLRLKLAQWNRKRKDLVEDFQLRTRYTALKKSWKMRNHQVHSLPNV